MSHELDITIPIMGLGVVDETENVRLVKKQIHLAILRALTKLVNATIQLAYLIVPESHPNDTNPKPYPPSYETEQLMNTYILYLNASLLKLKRGATTLREVYTIQQLGWDHVSYAEYVNQMRGVDWTKPTSRPGFIQKLDTFLRNNIQGFINLELQAIDRGQQLLYGVI
jgi:hypothetical protein